MNLYFQVCLGKVYALTATVDISMFIISFVIYMYVTYDPYEQASKKDTMAWTMVQT